MKQRKTPDESPSFNLDQDGKTIQPQLEEALANQRERWQCGERISVEDCLGQHAELKGNTEAILDLIYHEIVLREQNGETPKQEEYLGRFPQLSKQLVFVFEVEQGLQQRSLLERTVNLQTQGPGAAISRLPSSFTQSVQGQTIPGYEILEEIGRGGMGVVYKARQSNLGRLVALKMILAGSYAGSEALARFQTEAQAVARLQHPHIVQIYEVGEHDGHPFLSLEFAEGGNLQEKLKNGPLPPGQAAELIETLARTIDYAHQQGIVHRDLKPANILLAFAASDPSSLAAEELSKARDRRPPTTDYGLPKVTDFGLAKRLDEKTPNTMTGHIIGTPSFMAPEQAEGKKSVVGTAVDVYALGALLYDCLTGQPPFLGTTPMETLRRVAEDEPVSPRQLQPKTPRDLETICLKCLQKEPRKRYFTAGELADDLRRFQKGEPIAARPVGWTERAVKWVKRRPGTAAFVATIGLLVLALGIGGPIAAIHLAALLQEAEREREKTKQAFRLVEKEKKETQRQLDRARENLFTAQLLRVAIISERDQPQGWELLNDYDACPINMRDFAWRFYAGVCRPDRLTLKHTTFVGHSGPITCVAFSPDGKTLATGGFDRTIKLWRVATGQCFATIEAHDEHLEHVAFSPDGKTLVSASRDKTVKLWDVATGRRHDTFKGHDSRVSSVAFSPDGNTLASADWDKTIKLWNIATGQQRTTLKRHKHRVSSVAFSPDGAILASASWDKTIKLWNVATGRAKATLNGHTHNVYSVAFSRDGKTLASASYDKTVKLWDVATAQELTTLRGHADGVYSVAFSMYGKTLATGSFDKTVKLWDVATGQQRATLKGHNNRVRSVAFSPDGNTLASVGYDATVKIWQVAPRSRLRATLKGHFDSVTSVAFSVGGKTLASASGDTTVKLWDVTTGQQHATFKGHTSIVWSVAFSPDGKVLASGSADNTVKLWDLAGRQTRATLKGHSNFVLSVAFSADGKTLASAGRDKTIKLWDVATGRLRATLKGHADYVRSVAFSADGKTLASGSRDKKVKLWDLETGQMRAALVGHEGIVMSLALSADGKTLASAGYDRTLNLWDIATRRFRRSLERQPQDILSVAFNPDGNILASGSRDKTVKLWHVDTGREFATLKDHTGIVTSVAFSPDGKTLASASYDKTVRLWDLDVIKEQHVP